MAEEIKEFMEIGGSPVPGITLRQVLRGRNGNIGELKWSSNGEILASASTDGTICFWSPEHNSPIKTITAPGRQFSVDWAPNDRLLAAAGDSKIITIFNTLTGDQYRTLEGHDDGSICLAWSPNNNFLASGSNDCTIRIWDIEKGQTQRILLGHDKNVLCLAWSPDGHLIASGSPDGTIRLWNPEGDSLLHFKFSNEYIYDIAWMPNSKALAAGTTENRIHIVDIDHKRITAVIEGHTHSIESVAFSRNMPLLASQSFDHTVRFWSTDKWKQIAVFNEITSGALHTGGLSFNPLANIFASRGNSEMTIRIWDIDYEILIHNRPINKSVHYTTAKLVLVGDSGVGKTGLGWRLAHNEFKEHSSTHGQQFWVVPELKKTRVDGTECEAVLWDLAGQPDYRLVHSLYLDDVDTALVLFDPTNRQEPLAGVDFWLNQLKDKDKKLRNAILVGARTDRGTSTLTDAEIKAYCERNGVSGGYIPTSALDGNGLPELLEKLKEQIPWAQMTTTVTTVTFKKIKEFVLALKEKRKRDYVLVQPDGLRRQLQETDSEWQFSDAEMMTAVGHLATHGYVKIIHSSNGQHSILLAPDILANLASSIVLEARRNPRGLGVLEEERLLHGDYPFPELNAITKEEGLVLLDAAAVLFLERNLCFRETFSNQTFLVFPSLINEKRPVDETIKIEEGASYRVKGAVENVYASLVVLLGYTNTFTRTHQWQNQAQYEMGEGEVCGFKQGSYSVDGLELVLYYGQKTPESVRLMFRGMFERFLSRRDLEISRYQPVICPKCGAQLARNVVLDQLNKKKKFSFCHDCGKKLSLPNPEPLTRLSPTEEIKLDTQQTVAQYRTIFEAALVRVKGLLRDQGQEKAPTCFISYAWGVSDHERWVLQLAKDLRNAGVDVLLDRWHSPPGSDLVRYVDQIMKSDFVAVVGTPQLLIKYETQAADPVVAAELRLINLRLREPSVYGQTVIPLLLDGEVRSSFTPLLQTLVRVDFKQSAFYFRQLFDMIWRMYNLPFDNPLLEELQESMTPQEKP